MVPEDNSENALQATTEDAGAVFNEGAVFRVTELKPGFATPMLRTNSINYCLVLSGELEVLLDGGETINLRQGVFAVLRGTNQAWRNPSNATRCRVAVFMVEAQPLTTHERSLEPTL
jgi:quercetin dioxygenase-like cupin family protein